MSVYRVTGGSVDASSRSSESKLTVKNIITALVILALVGLVIYAVVRSAQKNKVGDNCKQGLTKACFVSAGKTARDTIVVAGPPIATCTTTGFASPPCIFHVVGSFK